MKMTLENSQKGLSLLELMIAMFIGLFLLAGIGSSYLSSKKTSVQRSEYSILQDNGRFALDAMTQTIVHAGYKAFPTGLIAPSPFITANVDSASCGTAGDSVLGAAKFSGNSTKNGATATDSDSVGVVYLGDEFVFTDCSGEPLPTECRISQTSQDSDKASIYSAFYIDGTTLQCAGSRTADAVPIADGIENMQVLYGVNLDNDPGVDRYVNETQMASFIDNIVSVQIAVLVRSSLEVKDVAESKVYSLLDSAYTSKNDRYLRAVFTTTVNLRNTL